MILILLEYHLQLKIYFMPQSPTNVNHNTLESYPWYYGEIDREATESVLEQYRTVSASVFIIGS